MYVYFKLRNYRRVPLEQEIILLYDGQLRRRRSRNKSAAMGGRILFQRGRPRIVGTLKLNIKKKICVYFKFQNSRRVPLEQGTI